MQAPYYIDGRVEMAPATCGATASAAEPESLAAQHRLSAISLHQNTNDVAIGLTKL